MFRTPFIVLLICGHLKMSLAFTPIYRAASSDNVALSLSGERNSLIRWRMARNEAPEQLEIIDDSHLNNVTFPMLALANQ